jgi:hypothetical protein
MQVQKVGEAMLPVFNKQVSLYYNEPGRLSSLSADVATEPLEVVGDSEAINAEEAREAAAEALGLPAELFKNPEKGIYLLNDDPKQARVSYQLNVPSGATQEPIQVYVDFETQEVYVP